MIPDTMHDLDPRFRRFRTVAFESYGDPEQARTWAESLPPWLLRLYLDQAPGWLEAYVGSLTAPDSWKGRRQLAALRVLYQTCEAVERARREGEIP